jgi:hypothetical protein
MSAKLLPSYTTPEELAAHLGVPERTLRQIARALGACSQIGKRMILTEDDVNTIMEATRCPSKSTGAAQSGTIEAPLTGGDFAALQKRLTEKSRKGSRRKSSGARGNVISMGRRPD